MLEWINGVIVELVAGAIAGMVAFLWRRSRSRARDASPRVEDLVSLVPHHRAKFKLEPCGARTDDDEAGLALISEIIRKKAGKCIEVIGRGPHLVDAKTEEYIVSVSEAILRGVEYRRILIIDDAIPENGLVWLLLLERFIALPAYSGTVALYPRRMAHGENLQLQFQLVDRRILHRTNRRYLGPAGASRRAQSLFAVSPHPDVEDYAALFQQHLAAQNRPPAHRELIKLMEDLLATITPDDSRVAFHWRLALNVIQFLDRLRIPGLPPKGFETVGSLMPFTFSYEAARRFGARRQLLHDAKPVLVIPFERFEDARQALQGGAIDHLCLPTENSRIDHLTPPTLTSRTLETLKRMPASDVIDVHVSFVLAGKARSAHDGRQLASVDAAWRQVKSRLPKRVHGLPAPDETVESNYHAAWLASRNPDIIAITSPAAASFFGLQEYERFESGITSFSILQKLPS